MLLDSLVQGQSSIFCCSARVKTPASKSFCQYLSGPLGISKGCHSDQKFPLFFPWHLEIYFYELSYIYVRTFFFAVFYQHFYGLVVELDAYVISFCNVSATWKPSSPSNCWRQLLRSTPRFFLCCCPHVMKCLFLIIFMLLQFIHVFLKSRTL